MAEQTKGPGQNPNLRADLPSNRPIGNKPSRKSRSRKNRLRIYIQITTRFDPLSSTSRTSQDSPATQLSPAAEQQAVPLGPSLHHTLPNRPSSPNSLSNHYPPLSSPSNHHPPLSSSFNHHPPVNSPPNHPPPLANSLPPDISSKMNLVFQFYLADEQYGAIPHPFENCNTTGSFFNNALAAWQALDKEQQQPRLSAVQVIVEGISRPMIVLWRNRGGFERMMDKIVEQAAGMQTELNVEVRCLKSARG